MTTAIQSCAQCRTVLLPGQSQCLVCGAQSREPTRECPVCGHEAPRSARFCTRCGQPLREQALPPLPEPVTEPEFVKVRNPGTRFYAIAGGAAALLLVLVSVHSFVAATFFTPQRAVTGYFDALAARDARLALSYLDPLEADGPLLTDAVLRHEGYRPPENIAVGEVPAEGDRRLVPVSFEFDGQPHRLTVFARRAEDRTLGVFRGWVIEGGLLTLRVNATGGVPPVINGVAVPENVAVFPGRYRMGLAANPLLQAPEITITAAGQSGAGRLVPSLKDSARPEIEASVRSYVDDCARSDSLRPPGCPFSVTSATPVSGVRWTIATYPTLTLSVDPATGAVNVTTAREGRAEVTGTSSGGTAFARTDSFRITGTAALLDGKVRFTTR